MDESGAVGRGEQRALGRRETPCVAAARNTTAQQHTAPGTGSAPPQSTAHRGGDHAAPPRPAGGCPLPAPSKRRRTCCRLGRVGEQGGVKTAQCVAVLPVQPTVVPAGQGNSSQGQQQERSNTALTRPCLEPNTAQRRATTCRCQSEGPAMTSGRAGRARPTAARRSGSTRPLQGGWRDERLSAGRRRHVTNKAAARRASRPAANRQKQRAPPLAALRRYRPTSCISASCAGVGPLRAAQAFK